MLLDRRRSRGRYDRHDDDIFQEVRNSVDLNVVDSKNDGGEESAYSDTTSRPSNDPLIHLFPPSMVGSRHLELWRLQGQSGYHPTSRSARAGQRGASPLQDLTPSAPYTRTQEF